MLIGNISVKGKAFLAPMAGVSNPAYFKICEKFGLGYAVTELISSEAVVRGNRKTFDMLKGIEMLSIPFAIQIFGNDPLVMGKAAQILEDKFHPSVIDINMGCPVPKVAIKNGAGSALMKKPELVSEIVSTVVKSVSCPVTVKIRSGWDSNNINAPYIAQICEKAGASMICIHARTRSQGYMGNVNLDVIKEVKESVSIPVIGNGDVKDIDSFHKMLEYTGCDAVMIGRACLGNPWLIEECNTNVSNASIDRPSDVDKINMIKEHYLLLKEIVGDKGALLEIRSHALWYLKRIAGIKSYKNLITTCKTEEAFFKVLNDILLTINNKNDKLGS